MVRTIPGFDEILSQDWSHQWLYDSIDIGPWLHSGKNVIAVLSSDKLPGYSLHRPGFAFRVAIDQPKSTPVLIESGADWDAQAVTAYGEGEMPCPKVPL